VDDGACQSGEQLIGIGHQRQVDLEALVHRGIGQALGHAIAVGCVGDALADLGQVIWALVCWTWAKSADRWRVRWRRRRKRARVARIWAGSTEAWGSLPPRSNAAILGESISSCLALPPWMAFM
jgi:hypothetical protein